MFSFQDGTIGEDLVVKPLPSKIRSKISDGTLEVEEPMTSASYDSPFEYSQDFYSDGEERHTNETDDYEFLDEDDKQVDVDVKVPSLNNVRRRGKREIRSDFHVVYKRKDTNYDHASDYRKYSWLTVFGKCKQSIKPFYIEIHSSLHPELYFITISNSNIGL